MEPILRRGLFSKVWREEMSKGLKTLSVQERCHRKKINSCLDLKYSQYRRKVDIHVYL